MNRWDLLGLSEGTDEESSSDIEQTTEEAEPQAAQEQNKESADNDNPRTEESDQNDLKDRIMEIDQKFRDRREEIREQKEVIKDLMEEERDKMAESMKDAIAGGVKDENIGGWILYEAVSIAVDAVMGAGAAIDGVGLEIAASIEMGKAQRQWISDLKEIKEQRNGASDGK